MNRRYIFLLLVGIGFAFAMFYIGEALRPFIVSFVFAYLFLPAVDYCEQKKISRSLASAIVVLGFTSIVIGVLVVLIPFLINKITWVIKAIALDSSSMSKQINHLILQYAPFLKAHIDVIDEFIFNLFDMLANSTQSIILQLTAKSSMLANIGATALCAPIISFYLLRDWPKLSQAVRGMVPRIYLGFFDNIVKELHLNLSYYLHGQLQVCLLLAIIYGALLLVSGLKFAIPIGIMIGCLSFMPYIGFIIGACVAIFVAFGQYQDLNGILLVVGMLFLGQILDANFVTPKIIGKKLNLHPNWIIFGLFASVLVFGVAGALLSLPITAIFTVVTREIIKLYKNSSYYRDEYLAHG